MAYTLSLAGLQFHGVHGEILPAPFDFPIKRFKAFGVIGESEIQGGLGGRDLLTEIWLHNSYSSAANLESAINSLHSYSGHHGTLTETGTVSRTWKNCTFIGYAQKRGPIYSQKLGWFSIGDLLFRQLSPRY